MTKQLEGTKSPMNTGGFLKRVCLALVVLLVASAAMVGAGSAAEPAGTIAQAIINDHNLKIADGEWITIYSEATICGTKSMVVKLYAGNELLGTTTLVDTKNELLVGPDRTTTVTWHFFLEGHDDYWNTEWIGAPVANKVPTKVELWVDGVKVDENNVYLSNSNDDMGVDTVLYNWGDLDGVMIAQIKETGIYYDTLQYAIDNATSGQTVTLLGDTTASGIKVAADDDVIIDLGENTVTGDFMVYGKATIKNGNIVNEAFVSGIESNGASADLTVENLKVTSDRHALRIDGGNAHIISGDYTSTVDGSSCYAVNIGGDIATTVIIDGGTFTPSKGASTQGSAVMIKNALCTVTINGGTFNTSTNTSHIYCFETYGSTTITGGIFNSGFVMFDDIASVSGGTFATDKVKTYCAEGYAAFVIPEGEEYANYYEVVQAYEVTFTDKSGTITMGPQTVKADGTTKLTSVDVDAVPRTGYTFAGWNVTEDGTVADYTNGDDAKFEDGIVKDGKVTLYAVWTPISYTVKFDGNGGTGSMADLELTYDESKTLSANAFTNEGHTFAGWAIAAAGEVAYADSVAVKNLTSKADDKVTLYAQWKINEYTITFNTDGGSPVAPITADYGAAVTAPEAPTKTGYTFKAWNPAVPTTMPAEDMTITATWTPITYTVSFDANGGDGEMGDQSMTYDESKALSKNTFTREGYNFTGWATAADGNVVYADGTTVKSLVETATTFSLYAIWTKKQVLNPELEVQTVTYNGQPQEFVLDGYSITYKQSGTDVSSPTNAGIYDVIISKAEDATYAAYQNTFAAGLVINKAAHPGLSVSANITALSGAGDVKLTVTGKVDDGTVTITCNNVDATETDGTYTLPNKDAEYIFTATDVSNNYTSATATCTVKVTAVSVSGGAGMPDGATITVKQISDADKTTLETEIEGTHKTAFEGMTGVFMIDVVVSPSPSDKVTFTIGYPAGSGITATNFGDYKFVVLHLNGATPEIVPSTATENGLQITSSLSPFAIGYGLKDKQDNTPVTPSSSGSSGSSVWLQEPVTPTETPTEQPTDKPTDAVPTDIPSTQPTEEPASPGFGVLAVLAGLGAVAALRRQ